jgi:hypothetical protein
MDTEHLCAVARDPLAPVIARRAGIRGLDAGQLGNRRYLSFRLFVGKAALDADEQCLIEDGEDSLERCPGVPMGSRIGGHLRLS